MYARIENNIVQEIIAMPEADFEYYFPADFRALCVECGPEVQQQWTYDGETFSPPPAPPEPPIEEVRAAKLSEVMRGYSAAFAPIEAIYPMEERETWPIQLEEARAVLADPTTETPMLSILVALRGLGETVTDFAQIVMINNTMYRQFAAYITGQQQRMYREVNALDTAEAILAYKVQYDMPPGVAEYLGL